MVFEDRLTLDTPEGVQLELTLAGVGSRFTAALVDYLIQGAVLLALGLVLGYGAGINPGAGGFAAAIFAVCFFLVFTGYDVSFEVLNSGRTPGKRLNGLRVVRENGAPVTFATSAVRNVLRLVDILPGWYLVGIASILITGRNQRLGDLAAGTIVIRDRRVLPPEVRVSPSLGVPAWDTSAIRQEELDTVVAFLSRRDALEYGARMQLARELASRLRPRIGGSVGGESDELFLERLVAAKRGHG
ncbi:MAG TPA: RDD family protein [Gaiellaceae bacterium]|nr:RDD family protein [Gaiellaceae bacterium]